MSAHLKINEPTKRIPRELRPGYAAKLLELFVRLEAMRHEFEPLSDDLMDRLTLTQLAAGKALIDAPAIDEATIAVKFRYAALLIEDPDGPMMHESPVLDRALHDLAGMRNADWNEMVGHGHRWYREVSQ